jgi:hypothetical protein
MKQIEIKGTIEEVSQKADGSRDTKIRFNNKDGKNIGFGVIYSEFGKLGDKIAVIIIKDD